MCRPGWPVVYLPDVGVLVRGSRQDVFPVWAEAGFDKERGSEVAGEGCCGTTVWPNGVIQVVHIVADAHQHSGTCTPKLGPILASQVVKCVKKH